MSQLTYIAGPFFSEEQKNIIKNIEQLLDDREEPYFSPREFGVISSKSELMNPARTKRIFDMNVRMVHECERMIAVTDNFDPGTMFEIGAFFSEGEHYGHEEHPLITYSPMRYGANVMIAHASWTHAKSLDQLEQALNGHPAEDYEVIE